MTTEHAVMLLGGYFLFSAIVGGMPEPTPTSGMGYLWAYRSLHLLAGNITTAISTKFPNLPSGATLQTTTIQSTTATAPVKEG